MNQTKHFMVTHVVIATRKTEANTFEQTLHHSDYLNYKSSNTPLLQCTKAMPTEIIFKVIMQYISHIEFSITEAS